MISKINLHELTQDNIAFWPLPIKCVIAGLCILLSSIGIYSAVLKDLIKQSKVLHAEAVSLQTTLNQQTQLLNQQVELENKLKTIQKQWTTIIQSISNSSQIANLLADITRMGIQEGLEFKTIHPLIEQPQGNLIMLPVELTVEGKHQQLKNFLLNLANFKKNIHLQNFKLIFNNPMPRLNIIEVDKFSLTLLINIYRAQNDFFLLESVGNDAKQFPQLENNLQGSSTFSAVNLDKLKMVGYLRQGDKQWALLAVPDNEVYRVNVGSVLNEQNARVIKITPYKVELLIQTQGINKSLTLQLRG